METTRNSVKVKVGIKVMKFVESLICWEVTVGENIKAKYTVRLEDLVLVIVVDETIDKNMFYLVRKRYMCIEKKEEI